MSHRINLDYIMVISTIKSKTVVKPQWKFASGHSFRCISDHSPPSPLCLHSQPVLCSYAPEFLGITPQNFTLINRKQNQSEHWMSYVLEKRQCAAHFPRAPSLTVLPTDQLSLVYNKYKTTRDPKPDTVRFNFVFAHGTGMNKMVWHYHIKKLYSHAEQNGWFLDTCISVDAISHGDSALLNQGKIGKIYRWDEGGKDLIAAVRAEIASSGDLVPLPTNKIIVVGHSLGGNSAVMAGFYEPSMFDVTVPVDAVLYSEEAMRARFTKVFKKIAGLLLDEFDSPEEVNEFYYDFSFYNTMKPEIIKDFSEDEVYPVVHEDGLVTYKTKADKFAQMATYLGSAYSLFFTMRAIELYRCNMCHVTGKQATWNPPQAAKWVRANIPQERLVKTADIDGTHLVHGDNPDGFVQVLTELVSDRHAAAVDLNKAREDLKYGGDRDKILEAMEEDLQLGEMAELLSKL